MISHRRKIIIITSCTGEKQYSPVNQLTIEDFRCINQSIFEQREEELKDYIARADEMYTGQQHLRLMSGIAALQADDQFGVELYIVSAGYGLISGMFPIAPYECTFQKMKARELIEWSNHLRLPIQIRKLLCQSADLVLVALGEQYLSALQLDDQVEFASPTLFLASTVSSQKIPRHHNVRVIALSNGEAKRFRCGLVGLKGELIKRILKGLARETDSFWSSLFGEDQGLLTLLDESTPQKAEPVKALSRLERVDFVIRLPSQWHENASHKKLRFFIPDWDDTVDPDYDFLNDTHAGLKGTWSNQVYAHQMFFDGDNHLPNSDGLLVSRAVAEKPVSKMAQIRQVGIHRYLRVPQEFPVMGDCGAFSYLLQPEPPYSSDEVLDYYTNLNFDYGVSIDHLLFGATDESGKKYRYELTIHNADEFITKHQKNGLTWTPIGALQGLNPQQYANAAQQYIKMGYDYLGIGGQVRSKTPEILAIAEAIRAVIPSYVKLHLFGVARLDALNDFMRVGINTVDSASYLRQAWIRMGQNYIGHDGLYAAIRIPVARKYIEMETSAERKQILQSLEMEALGTLRSLAQGDCSVDTCLNALLAYKEAVGAKFPARIINEYRATLTHRPWEQCDCAICKAIGVEVIIFRGNNRNRRRGFHNNYAFYHQMQNVLYYGSSPYNWRGVQIAPQTELPLVYEN